MSIIEENVRRFAANSIFPSFFLAVLGLVLAQAGAAQMHGSWGLHIFVGVPGVALAGLALFRARLHWPAAGTDVRLAPARALGSYILLLAAGAVIGAVACSGPVLALGIGAAFTYLLPWTKIPACRVRFVVSAAAVLAGAGAVAFVANQGSRAQSLYFMTAAWLLYFPAMAMHLVVLLSLDRGYRLRASRTTAMSDLDMHAPLPR
ncbi:hypothetical protein [Massilia luteola]|uniref:hypothetical protein n=1 Tax=Massilia luteola TaxID=3081751 RepID=UPI002ACC20A3|nr:hypothetical protein [Massilia sp. Gc5]